MITRRTFALLAGVGTATLALGGCSAGSQSAQGGADSVQGESDPVEGTDQSAQNSADASAQSQQDQSAQSEVSDTRFYFDTTCIVQGVMSASVLEGAFERCAFFQETLSAQEQGSDVDRINNAGGQPVDVSPETAEVVTKALEYCRASEGAFDITIGAASLLWDFKEGVVPSPEALAEAVKHIDYTQVQVSGTTVQLLDPQAKLDLGGVAKGYIADDLIDYLREQGVEHAFVNLGGNVKTLGTRPDGNPWRVGINDPNAAVHSLEGDESVMGMIESQGTSVVTSGLYERVFEQDGKRYWHILDPKTGYPVETDLAGATIVSDASIDGDGFTKPLFVHGIDYARQFFSEHPEFQGLLIDQDGQTWTSEGSSFVLR